MSNFCHLFWKCFDHSSRFFRQNQKVFWTFFFQKLPSMKKFPWTHRMHIWQLCQKISCQMLPIFLPTSEEIYTFMFIPKKMFTKTSAGYVKSKPDNPSKKLPKVNTFFSKPNAFLKIPLSGRKKHYSSKFPMDTWNAVLTKVAKVFTKGGMFSAKSAKTNTKSTIFLKMFVFPQKVHFWANVALFTDLP